MKNRMLEELDDLEELIECYRKVGKVEDHCGIYAIYRRIHEIILSTPRVRESNPSRRTREYRRHHRDRVINNRQNIVKNAWGEAYRYYFINADGHGCSPHYHEVVDHVCEWDRSIYNKEPGRLSKYNLKCTCWMCKRERYKRHKRKDVLAEE